MHLSIDLLQTFSVVAETRNFTAAGRRVHRSQSAVSMQMKRLAEAVGHPLFDIEGKRIQLNPMGDLLLEHAHRILKAHEAAVTAIGHATLKGRLRFGAPEDYASLFVPRILAGFAKEHPDIRVDVICRPSDQLYSELLRGNLDLVICTALDAGGENLCNEPVVWVTEQDGRALSGASVPLAVYGHNCIYRKWAIEALENIRRPFHIAYMSPSIFGILAAVRSGLAVAPVGLSVVTDDIRIVGPEDGFPELPKADIRLHKAVNSKNILIEKLAGHVRTSFNIGADIPGAVATASAQVLKVRKKG